MELPPLRGNPPATLPLWPSPRQVRRYCRQLAHTLNLTPPLDVAEICAQVARLRGRPIELVFKTLPAAAFGVSLPMPDCDYIMVQQHTSTLHREHIVLHELAHILAGHLDDHHNLAHDNREREWVAESIATVLRERAMVYESLAGAPPAHPASRALDEALRSSWAWR